MAENTGRSGRTYGNTTLADAAHAHLNRPSDRRNSTISAQQLIVIIGKEQARAKLANATNPAPITPPSASGGDRQCATGQNRQRCISPNPVKESEKPKIPSVKQRYVIVGKNCEYHASKCADLKYHYIREQGIDKTTPRITALTCLKIMCFKSFAGIDE